MHVLLKMPRLLIQVTASTLYTYASLYRIGLGLIELTIKPLSSSVTLAFFRYTHRGIKKHLHFFLAIT